MGYRHKDEGGSPLLAAAVVAILFVGILVVTWLSSRAEQSSARAQAHLRHIQDQLEVPQVSSMAARRRPGPPAPS